MDIEPKSDKPQFHSVATVNHQFPPTQIHWNPSNRHEDSETFGTSSDTLRLFQIDNSSKSPTVRLSAVLDSTSSPLGAPLTSFQW